MNYKVGDTVVCIDSKPPTGLRLVEGMENVVCGEKYIVAEMTDKCTGVREIQLPNWAKPAIGWYCSLCGASHCAGYQHFESWRFIKLDGLTETQDTSEEITA